MKPRGIVAVLCSCTRAAARGAANQSTGPWGGPGLEICSMPLSSSHMATRGQPPGVLGAALGHVSGVL